MSETPESLRRKINDDYRLRKGDPSRTANLTMDQIKEMIAFAKTNLRKNPDDVELSGWLTLLAERERHNEQFRNELADLRYFVDASGKGVIMLSTGFPPGATTSQGGQIPEYASPTLWSSSSRTGVGGELTRPLRSLALNISEAEYKNIVTQFEKVRSTPLKPTDLHDELEKVRQMPDLAMRQFAMQLIWGNLHNQGYNFVIKNNRVDVITNNPKDEYRASFETSINSAIARGSIGLYDIFTALMVGSSSFGGDPDKSFAYAVKSAPRISIHDYYKHLEDKYGLYTKTPEELKQKIKTNKDITPSDRAFLETYAAGSSIQPDITRATENYRDSVKVLGEVLDDPDFTALRRQMDPSAKPLTPTQSQKAAAQIAQNPASTPMDGEGKPITTIAGIIGFLFLLGYSKEGGFSFWSGAKRGLVLGIGLIIGCAAAGEWKKEMGTEKSPCSEMLTQIKGKAKEGAQAVAQELKAGRDGSAETAAPSANAPAGPVLQNASDPAVTFDAKKLSELQKAGVNSIRNNKSLLEDIKNRPSADKNQTATLDDYLKLLHQDSIQNITLDKLIYTPTHEQSIFSEAPASLFGDNADIKDTVSRILLKTLIRSYIGSNDPLSPSITNEPEGKKTIDAFKEKYPEADWKSKTLKDLINEIYKK